MNVDSMSSDSLREQIHCIPFHPFTLLLPSGKTVTVDNPELTRFTETGRTLLVSIGDGVTYIDVATVEAMETKGGLNPSPA